MSRAMVVLAVLLVYLGPAALLLAYAYGALG